MAIGRREFIVAGWLVVGLLCTGCAVPTDKGSAQAEQQAAIAELRHSVAELNSRIDELESRFSLLLEKVERARRRTDTTGSGAISTATDSPPKGLRVVKLREESPTPEELYTKAQELFLAGRYRDARVVFSELATTYPAHELTDNALYWLGETYYTEQNYAKALKVFKSIVENYPKTNKAPDAMLKWGYSLIEMEKTEQARGVLERLIKSYPHSEAAHKARDKLEKLKGS